MMTTKSRKRSTEKNLRMSKAQLANLDRWDVPALEQLIENMLEVNQWQNYLIQEAKRRIKNLAAIPQKQL